MTIAYWCVLIAIIMPVVLTGIAKIGSKKYGFGANSNPRKWQRDKIEGWVERMTAAHLNAYEALPGFAAAVIIAQSLQAPQNQVDGLAIAFIVLRIAYAVCYGANWGAARSLVWTAGLACVVGLFVVAA